MNKHIDSVLCWNKVVERIQKKAEDQTKWRAQQEKSLEFIAGTLKSSQQKGVILADQVGMGKTRVALAVAHAVMEEGGNVAIVVPPILMPQWQSEWKALGGDLKDILCLRRYDDLFQATSGQYPLTQRGRLLLISHSFGPKRFQGEGENYFAIRLPILSLMKWRRGGISKVKGGAALLTKSDILQCWKSYPKACAYCAGLPCEINRELQAANYLARLPACREWFENKDIMDFRYPAKALAIIQDHDHPLSFLRENLIGLLIGQPDLIVVDEAHKSRGVTDTMLGRLLSKMVTAHDNTRRLSLTATPMELCPEQWLSLLKRTGCEDDELEKIRVVIEAFENARMEVTNHPTMRKKIINLKEAGERYNKELSKWVTMRRRVDDPEMRELLCGKGSHRKDNIVPIKYDQVDADWRPVLLAMEALSQASYGSSVGNAIKHLGIRQSAGHIASVMKEENFQREGDNISHEDEAQSVRMQYWQDFIQQTVGRAHQGEQDETDFPEVLTTHPRIQATANCIEDICWSDTDENEKVLVFGVFTDPIKALNEVLNRRFIARLLEDGGLIPGGKTLAEAKDERKLSGILSEWKRVRVSRKSGCGNKKGNSPPSLGQVKKGLKAGGEKFEQYRKKVSGIISYEFIKNKLPGDVALKTLEDAELKSIREYLSMSITTDLALTGAQDMDMISGDIEERAVVLWSHILDASMRDTEGAESDSECTPFNTEGWQKADAESLKDIDKRADALEKQDLEKVIRTFEKFDADQAGGFSCVMTGGVKMEARQRMQSRFNQRNSFPKVIIAQSSVGREGLNLHRACRHIVLFHPEWNPGVVEQQIGRVDRIESWWEQEAIKWKDEGSHGDRPSIMIYRVVFEGTYDAHQASVLEERREQMGAHLFGDILNEKTMCAVPVEYHEMIKAARPDFSP